MHAGGLQMGSEAGNKLTAWRSKAEKACPQRKAAIEDFVRLLKDCFKLPERCPDLNEVVRHLKEEILVEIPQPCA